MEIERLMTTL